MPASSTKLSVDAIVDAGLELIDADGVGALTMRRIAERLGTSPMSLYRHVATKDELVARIADRYFAETELPDTADLPWQEAIVEATAAAFGAFVEHPHLREIAAMQHADAVAMFRMTEVILGALRGAGLDDREAVEALDTITSYAAGFTQRMGRTVGPTQDERLRRIHDLPRDEFGNVVELSGALVTIDFERRFEDGLRLIIDGIESRLGNHGAG